MDFVQQRHQLQIKQLKQEVEQEQKVCLESLKNQTKEQQKMKKNSAKELIELERNKKLSIEQLDQQILIKTKKIAELGRQEILKKQQLGEVMQKVKSQKRMLEVLESQAKKATETWKSNFDIIEQDWNCRVAEINAEEERRLKKVEDKERALRIEIGQKETVEREKTRKEFELELELVKKSIAEGYAKLKKIYSLTKMVRNNRYLQQLSANQQSPPIHSNQLSLSFNPILPDSPVDVEHCVPPPPPQPIIPNQPIQSGLFSRLSSSAQPSQLVCQFYNQQKVAAVNEFDSSFNTTTPASSTCVIPEMVQSSFSPSESTTSCPIPDNPINTDIDQRPNSTNGSSVICHSPSTSTLAPTVTTTTSTLFIPEVFTSAKSSTSTSKLISSPTSTFLKSTTNSPSISTATFNLDNITTTFPLISTTTSNLIPVATSTFPKSTTNSPSISTATFNLDNNTPTSKLVFSATSTLSKSFNENFPPISTVSSTSTSKSISSPTSIFPNSIINSLSISTATFNLAKFTPTSKLISSATPTLSETSPSICLVTSNLDNTTTTFPLISTTTSNLNPVATSTLSKSFNENFPLISTVSSTSTSKLISSPTSTFLKSSTTNSPSISTATFNLDNITPTSKLVSSATSTLSKTSSSISPLTFTLPNSSTLTFPPTSNLDKTYSKLDSSSVTLPRFSTFNNGNEDIQVDDLDYDDVEEEVMVNLDDCGTILANNIETLEKNIEEEETSKSIYRSSTNEELIEVNHIGGDDIALEANVAVEADVPENKPAESTNQIIERLVPESSNIDLGDDFESVDEQFDLVDNQNNTKLTSKTNNSRHQIKSKRRGRGNSKLRNNNKRIESNEERQQRLEQCREFYGLRKRKQEEEPHNSQASSELNRVQLNGKLRSNRDIDNSTDIDIDNRSDIDIDNRSTLESNGRSDGGGGVETSNQRSEGRSKEWKLLKIRETPEQRERRLAQKREWGKQRIANETPEQRERRLARMREWNKQRIANETPEQRELRLKDLIERQKKRIEKETPEERELRLAQKREYDKQKIANETPEQRELRLTQKRERLANETPKERKRRLATEQERYYRKKQKQ